MRRSLLEHLRSHRTDPHGFGQVFISSVSIGQPLEVYKETTGQGRGSQIWGSKGRYIPGSTEDKEFGG